MGTKYFDYVSKLSPFSCQYNLIMYWDKFNNGNFVRQIWCHINLVFVSNQWYFDMVLISVTIVTIYVGTRCNSSTGAHGQCNRKRTPPLKIGAGRLDYLACPACSRLNVCLPTTPFQSSPSKSLDQLSSHPPPQESGGTKKLWEIQYNNNKLILKYSTFYIPHFA